MNDRADRNGCVASLNGVDLYYEREGGGEPLLLLHGFTGSGGDWAHAGRDAFARAYAVIVPDARGHGRSTGLPGPFSHRQCALDTLALLDRLGVERCKAIGVSLGGNTLLHLAALAPGRVEAMVLVSATMYFPESARELMRRSGPEGRSGDEWRVMRERHAGGDAQIEALFRQARAFADDYDDMRFTPPALSQIAARALVVYGDRDPLYPVEMAVEMYRALPRASLFVLPGEGHAPAFGRAAGAFVDASLAFLRGSTAS
jgi:pimeloyl-ACP methyl ester carboxylesterase